MGINPVSSASLRNLPFLACCSVSRWRRFRPLSLFHHVLRFLTFTLVSLVSFGFPCGCLGRFCSLSSFCRFSCPHSRRPVGCPSAVQHSFWSPGFPFQRGGPVTVSGSLGFLARFLSGCCSFLLVACRFAPCLASSPSRLSLRLLLARVRAK